LSAVDTKRFTLIRWRLAFAFTRCVHLAALNAAARHVAVGLAMAPALAVGTLDVPLLLRRELVPSHNMICDPRMLMRQFSEADRILFETDLVDGIQCRATDVRDCLGWDFQIDEKLLDVFDFHRAEVFQNCDERPVRRLRVGEV
jgi:hypothetical protein